MKVVEHWNRLPREVVTSVTRTPTSFSSGPTFSLVFHLLRCT